MSSSISDLRLR